MVALTSSGEAQVASADRRISDSLVQEALREYVDQIAAQFGLASISRPMADTLGIELRIFESFGPGMAPVLVLREVHGAWSARRLERNLRGTTFEVEETKLVGDWGKLWMAVSEIGLLTLPSWGGSSRYDVQHDGHSILIELRQGTSYRCWRYGLGPPLTAEMERMLQVARAVRGFAPT